MANVTETATYDNGVYRIETTDPVVGGESGISNSPHKNLANRTAYLKAHVDAIESALGGTAPLASPIFTGDPRGPTASPGDNDTSLATTAFVVAALGGLLNKSVAGSANVTLTAIEAGNYILVFTGVISANISVIVPTSPTRDWIIYNSTTGAYTLTVKTAAGTGVAIAQTKHSIVYCDGANVSSAIDIPAAPVTSVNGQTGAVVVSAGGAVTSVNGNTGAVTISAASLGALTSAPVSSVNGLTGAVSITLAALAGAPLNSPALTGSPTAPTATTGARTTAIATMQSFADEFGSSLAANGYQKLPSGLIIQWGSTGAGLSDSSVEVTLPITFPTTFFAAIATVQFNGNVTVDAVISAHAFRVSNSKIKVGQSGTVASGTDICWLAIGY